MKRIALILAALLLGAVAKAQTQFPANTLWGNTTTTSGLPTTVPMPACPSGALAYTGGTGFTCVAIAGLPSIANNTVLGNVSGAAAAPVGLSQAQLTALCNPFGSGLSGCAPASGGGTANFLRADGTWATPPGAGGAVSSVSNSDNTLTIAPTTGPVVASLNLAHTNTWSNLQTFGGGISANGLTLSNITGVVQCLRISTGGIVSGTGADCGSGGGGGGISSVTSADNTLTFTTVSGAVTGALALGHANTWSALQTFSAGASLSGITGSTQCLHVNTTGLISGTGFDCGAVSSFNTRTGAVTLTLADVTGVGGAPIASPTFTGTVQIPALTLTGITGSVQCLHVNTAGLVSGAGADCGSGGGNLLPTNNVWTGTNNFTLNTEMGANVAADAVLTVNSNTASMGLSGVNLHLVGANGAQNTLRLDAFGNDNNLIVTRADGTLAAKTALLANEPLLDTNAWGWDGTNYGLAGSIQITAAETWSATSHGSFINYVTNPLGSTTATSVMRIQPSGGLSVGSGNLATDLGNGSIQAGSSASTVASQITITNTNSSTGAGSTFTAASNSGTMLLSASSVSAGSFGVLRWTGAGSFVMDAQNANGSFLFRTGATPTTALQIDKNQNSTFTGGLFVVQSTGVNATMTLDALATQQAQLDFNSAGVIKWILLRNSDGTFTLWDNQTSQIALNIAPGGPLNALNGYSAGAVAGVTCNAGQVNATTMVVRTGIVVHC